MKKIVLTIGLGVGLATSVGCGNGATQDVNADLDDDMLAPAASVYIPTANNGTLTLTAYNPAQNFNGKRLSASANLTGNMASAKWGVCLLELVPAACTLFPTPTQPLTAAEKAQRQAVTDGECGPSSGVSTSNPAGATNYCTLVDGTGSPVCAVRRGTPAAECAGSPASPTQAVQALGTPVSTPMVFITAGRSYVSYACYGGCGTSEPSVSSEIYGDPVNMYCVRYPSQCTP